MAEETAKFGVELEDGVTPNANKAKSSLERLKATIEKFNKTGVGKAIEKFQEWGKQAITIGAIATAGIAAAITTLTVQTVDFSAKTRVAFDRVAKHGESGEDLFQRSIALAQDLGLDVQATAKQIVKFRALQFDQGQAEDLIKMGADMRSLGASTDQVASIYLQFGQIMSKGRLQGEELTVLAENGISTKLVYENLAKSLHKTVPEIQKLMQGGKITAQQGLDAIGKALLQKTHTTAFGEAGKLAADQTLSGLLARTQSLTQGFFIKLADAVGPDVMKAFRGILDEFSDFGGEINLFDRLAEAMRLVARIAERGAPVLRAFLEGLAHGVLASATGGLLDIAEALRNMDLDDVFRLASSIGVVLGDLVIVLGYAAAAVQFFTTPLGRVVFWCAAVIAVIAKVVSFIAALAPVWEAIGTAITTIVGIIATALSIPVAAAAAVVAAVVASVAAIYIFRDEIAAFFTSLWNTATSWLDQLSVAMFQVGFQLMQGLINGITSMAGAVWDSITGIADGIVSRVKGVLQIQSPSKVFMGIGENVAAGFNMGVQALAMPEINAPSLGVDVPAPVVGKTAAASSAGASVGAAAGGGGASFVFAPQLSVALSGKATTEDGKAFGAGAMESMRSTWTSWVEDMAIEMGVNAPLTQGT